MTQSTSTTLAVQNPNPTIYIGNIDWSIKKTLLRKSLYHLFSRYGKLLDIIALRAEGLRGQAWVIFEELPCASSALRELQGIIFFGKPLHIQYSHQLSDLIARREGIPKAQRRNKVIGTEQKLTDKSKAAQATSTEDEHLSSNEDASSSEEEGPNIVDDDIHRKKRSRIEEEGPPSKILFASNLPNECNDMMIAMLFRQYAGFKECRMPRPGIAFIEFEDEAHATLAMRNLQGFKLTDEDSLNLSYGKV